MLLELRHPIEQSVRCCRLPSDTPRATDEVSLLSIKTDDHNLVWVKELLSMVASFFATTARVLGKGHVLVFDSIANDTHFASMNTTEWDVELLVNMPLSSTVKLNRWPSDLGA